MCTKSRIRSRSLGPRRPEAARAKPRVTRACVRAGVGAELCARVMESASFFELDAPAWRCTGADVPMPYARDIELRALPKAHDLVHAVQAVLGNK